MTSSDLLVIVDHQDLVNPSPALLERLESAYGPNGTGIVAIRNVPGFVQAKQAVLELAHPLAHLPPSELKELEDEASLYNAGWSHGKEQLKPGIPDLAKGSFYFNPIVDVPGTPEDRKLYPVSYPSNKWPKSTHPTVGNLELACKQLGTLMKNVVVLMARQIDALVHEQQPAYNPLTLYNLLKDTQKAKGRLLYYYPTTSSGEDSWIGWHNDSGFLTALAGDLYLDDATGELAQPQGQLGQEHDKAAGLYVVDRQNQVQKVDLPPDCMAIQIGECTQIITGGAVVATPHCVKGSPSSATMARASCACFVDTPPNYTLVAPAGSTVDASVLAASSTRVPPLDQRWEEGMTFGDFLAKTFALYYPQETTN